MLASCGSDNMLSPGKTSGTNSLAGGACGCNTVGPPVCGYNGNSNVTFLNSCTARCYNVTNYSTGNCICSESYLVCVRDENGLRKELTECEAKRYLYTIEKYSKCNAATL